MVREFKRPQKLMGNAFEITVISDDENLANQHIDAALKGTKLDDWSNSN